MKETFRRIATKVSGLAGSAWVFCLAALVVLVWALTGPMFGFSDTWQLVINTGTTIVTFLMVFLIQNTQNRDGRAMQLKLDELIRATRARDTFIDIEDLSDEELSVLAAQFKRIHQQEQGQGQSAAHKLSKELERVLTARHMVPGEEAATQMVHKLNPFGNHEKGKK